MRLIEPDWPRHPRVRAAFTTRDGGVSQGPYAALNLALHVGDRAQDVHENRRRLVHELRLPHEPLWLDQVHGVRVHHAVNTEAGICADAAWTGVQAQVCTVMTADCLPVLFADEAGTCVAAAHAGWRGLAAGILEHTVQALPVPAATLSAWLGPAIGPRAFEVGEQVRRAFLDADPMLDAAFRAGKPGHYLADLFFLARARLARAGVSRVHGGDLCTFGDARQFFSYRRDGACGRMAALIWLQ